LVEIDPEVLGRNIDLQVKKINEEQAEVLAVEIAAGFVAGLQAGEKKQSFLRSSSEELTRVQLETIEQLSAEYFGYIAEVNGAAGEQLKTRAREIILEQAENGGSGEIIGEEIRQYAEDIWGGSETITIDRTGQTRQVIEVTKDHTLRIVEKEITRAYHTTVDSYADMLARTSMHGAYEDGRAAAYQEEGFKMWRFVGPVDERSRPDHSAIVGQHFTYGTPESDMALQLLHEPNCRHRAIVYFDDPDLDTPQEEYEKQKEAAGLYYDEGKGWAFKESGTPKKNTQKKTPAKKKTEKKKETNKTEKKQEKSAESIIRDYEAKIKARKTEKAYLFDTNGNVLLEKGGTKNSVGFTNEEVQLFRGAILTHNHPGASSFSSQDIRTSCANFLKEIRATGTFRTYIMKMKDGSNLYPDLWKDKIRDMYVIYNAEVRRELLSRIDKGELSIPEAELLHWHEVWARVAKNISELDYSFIEEKT